MWDSIGPDWRIVGVGDFNGDGFDDLLWRSDIGVVTDWLGTAGGGFINNHANTGALVPLDWAVVGTGDFDGDGRDDLLWRNSTGLVTDWLGTTTGGFINNHENTGEEIPLEWAVVETGDFNGDGFDDILWRSDTGVITNWLGTASGGFINNHANTGAVVPLDWAVVGTGDFNGDGRDDMLWRSSTGLVIDWLGTSSGGFENNHQNTAVAVSLDWAVVGTDDFNGDGRDDVLWRHDSGTLTNWLGQPDGSFANNNANAWTKVATSWGVAGTGDFDGDGRDDILWRHESGAVITWLGQSTGGFVGADPVMPSYGGAPPIPPEADPADTWAIPTGPEWDEVMSKLETFFSEMETALAAGSNPGADQNSYYHNPYDAAPGEPTFLIEMGFMTHAAMQSLWNSWGSWPDSTDGSLDPEFAATALSGTGLTAQYSGGFVSILGLANNNAMFVLNGMIVQGVWQPGNDTTESDDAVVVTGGRWTFTPVGFAPNYANNVQYYGGDPAQSEAERADIADRQQINVDALGELDEKEHNAKDKLQAIINKVTLILAKLPPDAKLIAADGKIIEISELQELWARADFRLDPAGTADNNGYGNGGVGQALRNGDDPLFIIDVSKLYNYMNGKSSDLALHYVLHELIHVTAAGDQVRLNGGTHATTENPVESCPQPAESVCQGTTIPVEPRHVETAELETEGAWGIDADPIFLSVLAAR